MPQINITLPQKKYDAAQARTDAFNANQLAGNPAWVNLTVDQFIDQQVVTPIAAKWLQEDLENQRLNLRARYDKASAAIQAQVDALLPP